MKKISLISILSAIMLLTIAGSCSRKGQTKMTYSICQSSGDKISLFGYGCMRFPFVDDGNGNEVPDQELINELIDEAIRGGVNYFDVAPVYMRGMNEAAIGTALSRHKRENFFIATKMSNFSNFSLEFAKNMYQKSFEDLRVDYIDYYLLHSVGGGEGIKTFSERFIDNGLLDFLLEEKKAGRIRNLGWSFHGDVAVYDHMYELGIQWDFVMIQMNYIDWQHASGRNVNAEHLYHKALENNTQVVIMEPLLGGRLGRLSPIAQGILDEVNPGRTAAEWAFRYVGSFDNVLTILSGVNRMDHLEENLNTFSPMIPLNSKEKTALAKVTEIMTMAGYINCTGCDYCVPCPFGVDIPGILLRYNEYIRDGKEIDPNDPILQNAVECRGEACGLCEPKCPQRLKIVHDLKRIADRVNSN
jgi:predicted aldo/keto reductase-like oxidoreductase